MSDFSSQITVYLGKRDFVDHVGEVDPIGELGKERQRERERERERGGRESVSGEVFVRGNQIVPLF